jgi:hypothetical protein
MKKSLADDKDLGKQEYQPIQFKLNPAGQRFLAIAADGTNLGPAVPPPVKSNPLKLLFYAFKRAFKRMLKVFGL